MIKNIIKIAFYAYFIPLFFSAISFFIGIGVGFLNFGASNEDLFFWIINVISGIFLIIIPLALLSMATLLFYRKIPNEIPQNKKLLLTILLPLSIPLLFITLIMLAFFIINLPVLIINALYIINALH